MDIAEDIHRIKLQEERLQFSAFDSRTAWELGLALKAAAEARQAPIVVDIRLYSMRLLSFARQAAGRTISTGCVASATSCFASTVPPTRSGASSPGRQDAARPRRMPERDYAAHGGSFPILLKGTGCIGAVTVSGLPQREDHRMVVEALALVLGQDLGDAALD